MPFWTHAHAFSLYYMTDIDSEKSCDICVFAIPKTFVINPEYAEAMT